MPIAIVDGHRIHYELHGPSDGPTITFINGLSMRTTHWSPYFQRLPAWGCRVLSYDMPGQGLSSKPVLGLDFDGHTRTLYGLHRQLGIERPYVLGISFGGVVALKYALAYPDAIRAVIPASTFSELDERLRWHSYNLFKGLTRVGFEYYLELLMPMNFSNEFLASNREFNNTMIRAGVAGNELFGIQNIMESLMHFEPLTARLKEIKCPALVLNGERDYLTPRNLHDIMRRALESSRLYVLAGMAHAFTLEAPERVARLLADFVAEVEEGRWEGDQSVWFIDDPDAEPLPQARVGRAPGVPSPGRGGAYSAIPLS